MSAQIEALRLADSQDCVTDDNCGYCMPCSVAAELRRLWAENEAFGIHLSERMKDLARVEAQRDALLRILKSELQHAEWQDMIIYPVGSEDFQNWRISIYLPVPLSASDKSPQAALDHLVDATIKAVEGENT